SFPEFDVINGSHPKESYRDQPGRLWVTVEGTPDSLCFYGREEKRSNRNPLILLEGDVISSGDRVSERYTRLSRYQMQLEAERFSIAMGRTFVNLARPGTYGSTGIHKHRRRAREVALIIDALDQRRDAFQWYRVDLV